MDDLIRLVAILGGLTVAYAAGWWARGWRPATGKKTPASGVPHAETGEDREPAEAPVQGR